MTNRVVIIGGGFGGLEAAFTLKAIGRGFDITVVDRSAYHSFIPSIHLIISGKVSAGDIRIPLGPVIRAAGMRFIHSAVSALDARTREVTTADGVIPYDYCLISSGATNNFFNLPGAEQFSCRFRTPEDAEKIRAAVQAVLGEEDAPCRIAVAGAGTEGVEVIGELLDLIRDEGREEELRAGRFTIELIEGKTALLPSFPAAVREQVEAYLEQRGVTITAGDRIAEVKNDQVRLESGRVSETSILIWSGGIQPSPFIQGLDFPKDPWGWLKVTNRLHVPGDETVYGIGDGVSIYTDDGPLALQRLAYHAQDQARVAALNIAASAGTGSFVLYEPKSKPQLISIGSGMGIFSAGDRVASGSWVVTLKKAIERKHLMTYLTKPLSSALWSRLPGTAALQRFRIRLPL